MDTVLLGYFPKKLVAPPDWMVGRGIEEVGSVSLCIADGPEGWVDSWKHNEWGFFMDPDVAWGLVPGDQQSGFALYAYALYPFEFRDGVEEPMEIPSSVATPLGPEYVSVGWDAVSRSGGRQFECSPLSCNLMAETVAINRYCLFAEFSAARTFALTADQGGCEPGPYHVVGVWRRAVGS